MDGGSQTPAEKILERKALDALEENFQNGKALERVFVGKALEHVQALGGLERFPRAQALERVCATILLYSVRARAESPSQTSARGRPRRAPYARQATERNGRALACRSAPAGATQKGAPQVVKRRQ